jgi:gliding motility-associated-like protein
LISFLKKISLLLFVIITAGEISAQWLSDYTYRKKIVISDSVVYGSEDLVNYPLLVSLIDPDLQPVSHGGLVFSEDGWDIVFTGEDGTTLLDHEMELFTASAGELVAWVRIPSLSHTEDTEIYLYFGNQSADSDPSTSSTWSTDFHGVWHLNRNAEDVSQYSNTGTNNGALSVTGKIGNAYRFDGLDDNINIPNHASLNITGDITLEAWARITDESEVNWVITGKHYDYWLWYEDTTLRFYAGETNVIDTIALTTNQWYHVAGTYDGSTMRLYLDGTEVASKPNSVPTSNDSNAPLTIGNYPVTPDPWNFTGDIDEVRISAHAHSGDWIKTSYSNHNNPALFSSAETTETLNDNPCDALVLPVDTTCVPMIFSNQYASDSGIPLTECDGYAGSDVWFKIEVPPGGNVAIKIESDSIPGIPDTADMINQPGLAVYSGTCGSLTHDTCWIDPGTEAPFLDPWIVLNGYTPGDTLHLRIWENGNDENGKFSICTRIPAIEIFSISGSGSYCSGGTGLTIQLDSSEVGVDYQLKKNGINQGVPIPGTGDVLTWPGQTEGVYEVVATMGAAGLSENMDGQAIVIEDPLPVTTFGYGYDKLITIDSGNVAGTDDLVNFPMLVSIPGDNDLRSAALGGDVQNSTGYDIVFTDENYNPIPFERISYDPATGAYSAWVNVPTMYFDSDTRIHMLYGNPGISNDHSSNETWSSGYVQVMHLDGDFTDASMTGNYGVNDGTSDTGGKLGSARSFDGVDNKITVFDDPTLDSTNDEATFSLWINWVNSADGDYQLVMCSSNRYITPKSGYEWASQGSGNHYFYPNGETDMDYNLGPNPFTDNTWQHLAVTFKYSTKEVKIFMNGIPMSFTVVNVPTFWTSLASIDTWFWGGNPTISTRYFTGSMDEIRVQTVARSGDWLRTEYMNQNDPSGFYSVSPEVPHEPFTDVCFDAVPFVLSQPKPAGGSFSGTGVSEGFFDPALAGPDDHVIRYDYTDASGCTSHATEVQTVLAAPFPMISGNDSVCPNSAGEIYTTPDVSGHSYTWVITGAGASIAGGQGSHELTVDWSTASGTVSVTETDTVAGCDSTTADFLVTVEAMGDPVIICPGDQAAYFDDQCEFMIPDYTTLASIEGNCGMDPVITQLPVAGTVISGSGATEIIIKAQFDDSITTDCSFNVFLQDTIGPFVTSLNDTTLLLEEGIYKILISMPVPAFKDNCGVQTIVNDFNGGEDATGEYSFGTTSVVYTVTDVNGNINAFTQQVTLTSIPEPEWGLVIPEGFSPNEDGLNDRFEILGLEQYPYNELRVFNVNGNEVYRMAGYDNSWDGTSASNLNKGGRLPTGTYYYALYLGVENAIIKGFVYLRRE